MKKSKLHYGQALKLAPDCNRCSLRRQKLLKYGGNRVVWGHGSAPARIMIVLEAPGISENYKGIPACGATGDEIDAMLLRQGIHRRDVYVTNVCKCMPVKDSKGYADPTQEQVTACNQWLKEELDKVDPDLVIAGGKIAFKALLGLEKSMELTHGFLYKTPVWSPAYPSPILSAYHPAAGMHNPRILAQVQQDWAKVRDALKGTLPIRTLAPRDPMQRVYEKVDDEIKMEWFLAKARSGYVAIDTEDGPDGLWSVQVTPAPGYSMFIADSALWAMLGEKIRLRKLTVVVHHSLHDFPHLERVGIITRDTPFVDTMILAYLLCDEPQGLKALAYRHCGVYMESYSETVSPIRYIKTVQFITQAMKRAWPDPEQIMEWRIKDGERVPHVKQPQNVKRKLTTLYKKVASGKEPDPYNALRRLDWYDEVVAGMGYAPEGYLCDLPLKDAMSYACCDPDMTYRVYESLQRRIEQEGLGQVSEIDHGVVWMTIDMMQVGILADRDKFTKLHRYFQAQMRTRAEEIFRVSGKRINLRSFPQLSEMLYDHMGFRDKLPDKTGKKTGSTMTSDEVLSQMETYHPVFKMVREWRDCSDLDAKFAKAIPEKHIAADGRVRCEIMLTRTETGRLATKDPNLMAMPTRTEDGKQIRACFVAKIGCTLLHMDYSQVELRMIASQANEETMIQAFLDGKDIHRATAAEVFGKPEDEITKAERRGAKTINFGIVYGITGEGLYRNIRMEEGTQHWTVAMCDELIDHYLYETYPGIGDYMDEKIREMLRTGKVSDWAGRIRLTPGVRLVKQYLVEAAKREGCNMPIQSGAQEPMKMSQNRIQAVYVMHRKAGYWCWPLLQIHDALLSEVENGILSAVIEEQRYIMETIIDLPTGIKVDVDTGYRWGGLESLEKEK